MIRTIEKCAHCQTLSLDGLEVDLERRELRYGETCVHLEGNESAMFYAMAEAGGRVVPYGKLIHAVWGSTLNGGPDYAVQMLKVYVCRMRAKLRRSRAPIVIRTVHGSGFAFERAHPRTDTRVLRHSELTKARTDAALEEVQA